MQKTVPILVGILFIAIGVFLYFKNDALIKRCTSETVATVVDLKEEFSSDTDSNNTSFMYYPVIEYVANGQTLTAKMDSGSEVPKYSINDKIDILYNPDNINEFIVKGDSTSNLFTIIFSVIGLLVTGIGIVNAFKKN